MLVLSRYPGQWLEIGDEIKIKICDVSGKKVRVGIEAPPKIRIRRPESGDGGPVEFKE